MKIGVFDSGVGGASVANAIKKQFPADEVYLKEDRQNLPYGTKTPSQLIDLVKPILLEMQSAGCSVIVIACNTVTTNIIKDLRAAIKVPLIGIEPMIRPASLVTKTGVVTVCATPMTLASGRYGWLKETYGKGVKFIEPDCSDWADMIEKNTVDSAKIREIVELSRSEGSDVIVLGCTHYHWIYSLIDKLSGPNVTVLLPEEAVVTQLKRVLSQLD